MYTWLRRMMLVLIGVTLLVGAAVGDHHPALLAAADDAPADDKPSPMDDAQPVDAGTTTETAATPTVAPGTPGVPGALNRLIPPGRSAAIIRIEGDIYGFTKTSLERRVDRAIADGADLIILELDTYGGQVITALELGKYIRQLTQRHNIPTLAWINDKAYSAGIMIAAACNGIVMSSSSHTGDCAPIIPGMELAPTERAKALSPLITEFKDSARTNGYDYPLLQATAILGVEVYYVEHQQTGERRFVNQADYMVMTGKATLDVSWWDRWTKSNPTGAEGIGQVRPETALDADRGMWEPVTTLPSGRNIPQGRVHDGTTLLTIGEVDAMDYGLARGVADTPTELKNLIGAVSITYVENTWSENLAGFLTSLPVRSVLILALMLGAYIEFQTPGVGLAGAVAVIAIALLLAPPVVIGLAEIWEVLLFFVGVVLLLIEIFVIPGFGVFGITGLMLMFTSLVLVAVGPLGNLSAPSPSAMADLQNSVLFTLLGIVLGCVALGVVMHYFTSIPLLNRMVLADTGPTREVPAQHVSGDEAVGGGAIKIGALGSTVAKLRPVGRANFGGRVVDVMTAGEFIDTGTQVRVVEVQGNRIVVAAQS